MSHADNDLLDCMLRCGPAYTHHKVAAEGVPRQLVDKKLVACKQACMAKQACDILVDLDLLAMGR